MINLKKIDFFAIINRVIAVFTMSNSLETKIATTMVIEAMLGNIQHLGQQLKSIAQSVNAERPDDKNDVIRREIPIELFDELKIMLGVLNETLKNGVEKPFSVGSIDALREVVETVRTVSSSSTLVKVSEAAKREYELIDLNKVQISTFNGGMVDLNRSIYTNSALFCIFNLGLQYSKEELKSKVDEDSEICTDDLCEEGQKGSPITDLSICMDKDVVYLRFSGLFNIRPTKCKFEIRKLSSSERVAMLDAMGLSAVNNPDFKIEFPQA